MEQQSVTLDLKLVYRSLCVPEFPAIVEIQRQVLLYCGVTVTGDIDIWRNWDIHQLILGLQNRINKN